MKRIRSFLAAALLLLSTAGHAMAQPVGPQQNNDHLCRIAFERSPAAASCTLGLYQWSMPGSVCTIQAQCLRNDGRPNWSEAVQPYNVTHALQNCNGVLALRC